MRIRPWLLVLLWIGVQLPAAAAPQTAARPRPLAAADIDAIAQLLKIEDTRQLDALALGRILKSTHAEVRRRAVQTIARVPGAEAADLLTPMRTDADAEVVATVAFAYGQLKDTSAVGWLGDDLSGKTPATVAREAARSLGKIASPEARTALIAYLTKAPVTPAASPVAGEALLSLGRFPAPVDVAAVARWSHVADAEVRWRAAWALMRPRDLNALPDLLRLSRDASPDVRFWAMRGLGQPAPPAPPRGGGAPPTPPVPFTPMTDADRATCSARLREGVADPDRRVRTEALRALTTYDDDASFAIVLRSIDSADSWIAVSAVEQLGKFASRKDQIVPRLVAATASGKPLAVRITALAPLTTLAPEAALDLATSLLHVSNTYARTQALATLRRLGADGRARLDAAVAADPTLAPLATPPARGPVPARAVRSDDDYRKLVTQWIVPDYNGAPKPHVIFGTPRGEVEIELYPGDAPFGVEYMLDIIRVGDIVGTAFSRVVPNFVDQEEGIRRDAPLRDEVSRRGLTRGNLSWASSGLDTGRPGYTLGITPQPHNEGGFTALGRVVRGMDAVDHVELGDTITSARVK